MQHRNAQYLWFVAIAGELRTKQTLGQSTVRMHTGNIKKSYPEIYGRLSIDIAAFTNFCVFVCGDTILKFVSLEVRKYAPCFTMRF